MGDTADQRGTYRPARVISAVVALTAFALAIAAGLAAGNPGEQVLVRAIVAMFVGQLVGWGVGAAAEVALREHLQAFRDSRQVPEVPGLGGGRKQQSASRSERSSSRQADGAAGGTS